MKSNMAKIVGEVIGLSVLCSHDGKPRKSYVGGITRRYKADLSMASF